VSKRQYSEDDKASVLALLEVNGGNITQTANELQVPASTIRQWRDGGGVNGAVTQKRDLKKGTLADKLEAVAHKLVAAMEGKIDDATLQQVTTSLGIAVDKMQLLRNKPTEIVDDASLTDEERANRVVALLERARARRARASADD
jgi:transposase-like protein